MKHKYIIQQDEKDCGVICLYNIIKFYKGSINANKLRNMLNTDRNGTSIYDIVNTSNKLGLEAEAYRCDLNDLCDLKFPLIAHIKIDGKYEHFVILDEIIDDEIVIFDPIRGYFKIDLEKFSEEWTNIIITFKPTKNIIKEKDENILKNLFVHILNNRLKILIVFIFSILFSILSVVHNLFLSYLYENPSISFKIFIIFIIICIVRICIDYFRNTIILKHSKVFDENITCETYNKILSLPLSYHHNRPVGDIVSRINDLSSIKEFLNSISFSFIIDVMYILFISIILVFTNKFMYALLLIISIIYVLIYLLFREKIKNNSMLNKENYSVFNTYLVENLLAIDTIKNLNIENNIFKRFKEKKHTFLNSNLKLNKLIINYSIIEDFVCNISSIIIIFIGIIIYKKNLISLSNVISFNLLTIYYFMSLKNIISTDNIIIEAKNSYKRLNDLYHEKEEEKSNSKLNTIDKISVSNLNYSYNGMKNIINNINFTINKNDYVFVKGNSGTGKSTIFKLVTKQLKIDRDIIKINDIDINDIKRKEIINNICFVSQNEFVFTDTILNNIKLFSKASKKEIDEVIRITNIDEILKKRNITLDFLLEENGHNLSAGERQRIILARSLIKGKKVLILDETMNELDISSERDIIQNIKNKYDITLILISHRDNNSDLFNKIIKI